MHPHRPKSSSTIASSAANAIQDAWTSSRNSAYTDSTASSRFKSEHSLDGRKAESSRIKKKYPDRIPIIVEKAKNSKTNVPDIDKKKYLVPYDLTIGQFVYVIRKRIKLRPDEAIFVFVRNVLPPTAAIISQIYDDHMDEDGFLYITYSGENTFGMCRA